MQRLLLVLFSSIFFRLVSSSSMIIATLSNRNVTSCYVYNFESISPVHHRLDKCHSTYCLTATRLLTGEHSGRCITASECNRFGGAVAATTIGQCRSIGISRYCCCAGHLCNRPPMTKTQSSAILVISDRSSGAHLFSISIFCFSLLLILLLWSYVTI